MQRWSHVCWLKENYKIEFQYEIELIVVMKLSPWCSFDKNKISWYHCAKQSSTVWMINQSRYAGSNLSLYWKITRNHVQLIEFDVHIGPKRSLQNICQKQLTSGFDSNIDLSNYSKTESRECTRKWLQMFRFTSYPFGKVSFALCELIYYLPFSDLVEFVHNWISRALKILHLNWNKHLFSSFGMLF